MISIAQVVIRRLAFFKVMLIIFLMFKTWDGIPAMQGVSATIINASSRLFSFGIILLCLLTLFSGGAMLAFGTQMEQFHTFPDAFVTTLIVMTSGTESIYEVQFEIDPVLASLWHWLLVVIMYVVCLNLLLCILVDAYGESQAQLKQAQLAETNKDYIPPTLSEQSLDMAFYCVELMKSHMLKAAGKRSSTKVEKNVSRQPSRVPAQTATNAANVLLIRNKSRKIDIAQNGTTDTMVINSDKDLDAAKVPSEDIDVEAGLARLDK
jgi:hypothetical protein